MTTVKRMEYALNALGGDVKADGSWDKATEARFRQVFGSDAKAVAAKGQAAASEALQQKVIERAKELIARTDSLSRDEIKDLQYCFLALGTGSSSADADFKRLSAKGLHSFLAKTGLTREDIKNPQLQWAYDVFILGKKGVKLSDYLVGAHDHDHEHDEEKHSFGAQWRARKYTRVEDMPQAFFLERRDERGMPEVLEVAMPLKTGTYTSGIGNRDDPTTKEKGDVKFHAGNDLGAPMGTPVYASFSGEVTFVGWKGDYGYTVVYRDGDTYALNAHMRKHPKTVDENGHSRRLRVGDRVEAGQKIGNVSDSGSATGPHLHWEVRHRGELIDPFRLPIDHPAEAMLAEAEPPVLPDTQPMARFVPSVLKNEDDAQDFPHFDPEDVVAELERQPVVAGVVSTSGGQVSDDPFRLIYPVQRDASLERVVLDEDYDYDRK